MKLTELKSKTVEQLLTSHIRDLKQRHLVYLAKYRHAKRDWDALQVTLEGLDREVRLMFSKD